MFVPQTPCAPENSEAPPWDNSVHIGVQLIYSIALVSGGQQSDSGIFLQILYMFHIFNDMFWWFSH